MFRAQYNAEDDVQNCATCDCCAKTGQPNLTVQRPRCIATKLERRVTFFGLVMTGRLTRLHLRLLPLLLIALSAAFAQEEPTFRTQSNVVLVPALVRDQAGNIVYGLQASDFVVEDDGVAQSIRLDEAAEDNPVSLVVAVQCGRRANFELPRMKGLASMLQAVMDQPGSKIALVSFDSHVYGRVNFTSNHDEIKQSLRNLQPGDDGSAILDAVNYSVKLLETVPKDHKRVLLLISETRDHGSKTAKIEDVIRDVGDSNIVVYTLAFAPWKSNMLDTLKGANNPDLHPEQTEVHEDPDLLAPIVMAVEAMRKNTPRAIAAQSGGEFQMFLSAKTFDARLNDFSNHLHSRYLLSFQPARPKSGLHQLTVALKQPGNDSVLARTSYWAQGSTP
jgi:VWFA-related protein